MTNTSQKDAVNEPSLIGEQWKWSEAKDKVPEERRVSIIDIQTPPVETAITIKRHSVQDPLLVDTEFYQDPFVQQSSYSADIQQPYYSSGLDANQPFHEQYAAQPTPYEQYQAGLKELVLESGYREPVATRESVGPVQTLDCAQPEAPLSRHKTASQSFSSYGQPQVQLPRNNTVPQPPQPAYGQYEPPTDTNLPTDNNSKDTIADNDTILIRPAQKLDPEATIPERTKNKKPRRYCCCFRTCWGCCLIFMLILIVIGVGLYFVFPQVPSVNISEPYVPAGSPGLLVNGKSVSEVEIATILASNNFTLTLFLAEDISIYSPSYINFGVKTLEVSLQPKQQDGTLLPNFSGFGKQQDLRFPSRTTTNFTVPISLTYSTTVGGIALLTDPAIQLFSRTCAAVPQQKIPVQLKIRLEISALSWTGFWPSYKWDTQQNCPEASLINQLLGKFRIP